MNCCPLLSLCRLGETEFVQPSRRRFVSSSDNHERHFRSLHPYEAFCGRFPWTLRDFRVLPCIKPDEKKQNKQKYNVGYLVESPEIAVPEFSDWAQRGLYLSHFHHWSRIMGKSLVFRWPLHFIHYSPVGLLAVWWECSYWSSYGTGRKIMNWGEEEKSEVVWGHVRK